MTARIISKKTNFSGVYNSNSCYTLGDDYDSTGSVEAKAGQRVYYDRKGNNDYLREFTEGVTSELPMDRYVSKIPRHGENVASYVYNPPHLIFNKSTDTTFTQVLNESANFNFEYDIYNDTTERVSVNYDCVQNFAIFNGGVDARLSNNIATNTNFKAPITGSDIGGTTFRTEGNYITSNFRLYEYDPSYGTIALQIRDNQSVNLSTILRVPIESMSVMVGASSGEVMSVRFNLGTSQITNFFLQIPSSTADSPETHGNSTSTRVIAGDVTTITTTDSSDISESKTTITVTQTSKSFVIEGPKLYFDFLSVGVDMESLTEHKLPFRDINGNFMLIDVSSLSPFIKKPESTINFNVSVIAATGLTGPEVITDVTVTSAPKSKDVWENLQSVSADTFKQTVSGVTEDYSPVNPIKFGVVSALGTTTYYLYFDPISTPFSMLDGLTLSDNFNASSANINLELSNKIYTCSGTASVTLGGSSDILFYVYGSLTLSTNDNSRAVIVLFPGSTLTLNGTSKSSSTIYQFDPNGTITADPSISYLRHTFEISAVNTTQMTFSVKKTSSGFGKSINTIVNVSSPKIYNANVRKSYSNVFKYFRNAYETTNRALLKLPSTLNERYALDSITRTSLTIGHVNAITRQIQYQYNLKVDQTGSGETYCKLTFERNGQIVDVHLAYGPDSEVGFLTQSAGFDYYTHTMIRSQKSTDGKYKIVKGGHYTMINSNGEIVMSGSPLDMTGTFDIFGTDATTGQINLGEEKRGQDFTVTANEIFHANNARNSDALFIGGMMKSCYRYAPLNGYVVSVVPNTKYNESTATEPISDLYCDYEIVDGVLYIRNRFPSKSRAITLSVKVKGSTMDLAQYCNTAENFAVNSHQVTFVGDNYMHLMYNSDTVQDVMIPLHKNSATSLAAFTGGLSSDIITFSGTSYAIGTGTGTNVSKTTIGASEVSVDLCVVFQGIGAAAQGTYGKTTPQTSLAGGRSVFHNYGAFIPGAWMKDYPITNSFKYLDPRHYDVLAPGTGSTVSIGTFFETALTAGLHVKKSVAETEVPASTLSGFVNIFTLAPVVLFTGKSGNHFYIKNSEAYKSSGDSSLGPVMYQSAVGGKLKAFHASGGAIGVYFISNVEYTNRDNAPVPVVINDKKYSKIEVKKSIKTFLQEKTNNPADEAMVNFIFGEILKKHYERSINIVQATSSNDFFQEVILFIEKHTPTTS